MDNNQIHDPSLEGTQGLSGLKGVNRLALETEPAPFVSRRLTRDQYQAYEDKNKASQLSVDNVGIKGLGDSRFDKDIQLMSELENLGNFRGEQQSGFELIGAGIAKAGVLAGTTLVNSTAGLIVGAIDASKAALNGEGSTVALSKFFDNDVTLAMIKINDLSEELMPNYYTNEEQDGPWYDHLFTANFIGDKMLKNMGFTIGSIGAAALTGGLVNPIFSKAGKAGAIMARSLSTVISAAGEATFEGANGSKEFMDSQVELIDQVSELKQQEIYDKYALILLDLEKEKDEMIQDPNTGFYVSKKMLVKGNIQKMMDDELDEINKQRESSIEEANNQRLNVGNTIMGLNMAILGASNNILFSRILSGGFGNAKALSSNRMRNKLTGDLIEGVQPRVGAMSEGVGEFIANGGYKKKLAKNILGNGLSEGMEEGSQNLASNTALKVGAARMNKFLGYKLNPIEEEELDNHLNSFTHALNELFGSIDSPGWEEFVLGFASGLIGVPMVKRSGGKLKASWAGGVTDAIQETKDEMGYSQSELDVINAHIQSTEFIERYQNLIRRNSIQNDMDAALAANDMVEYKNNEFSQMVNDAIMFRNIDEQDTFLLFVDSFTSLTDEDIESIRTLSVDESTGKSIYEGKTNEDIRKEIQDRATKAKKQFKQVLDTYSNLSVRYGDQLSKDAIEELSYIKSMMQNSTDRMQEISENISQSMKPIAAYIGKHNPNLTDELNEWGSQIAQLLQLLADLNPMALGELFQDKEDGYAFEDLISQVAHTINNQFPNIDSRDITDLIRDIMRLADQAKQYSDRYNSIVKNEAAINKFEHLVQLEKLEINDEVILSKENAVIIASKSVHSRNEAENLLILISEDPELAHLSNDPRITNNPFVKDLLDIKKFAEDLQLRVSPEAFDLIIEAVDKADRYSQLTDLYDPIYNDILLEAHTAIAQYLSELQEAELTAEAVGPMAGIEGASVVGSFSLNDEEEVVVKPAESKPDPAKPTPAPAKPAESTTTPTPTPTPAAPAAPVSNIRKEAADATFDERLFPDQQERLYLTLGFIDDSKALDKVEPTLPQAPGGNKFYYAPTVPYFGNKTTIPWNQFIYDLIEREKGKDKAEEQKSNIDRIYAKLFGENDKVLKGVPKVGEQVFMAKDNTYDGDDMFMVVKDGDTYKIVGSFPVSKSAIARQQGLEGFMDRAKQSSITSGDFTVYTGESLRVSKLMDGKVRKMDSLLDLSSIDNLKLLIVGSYGEHVLSDKKIDKNSVLGVIEGDSGGVYLLYEKASGGYGVNKLIVSHFNRNEFKFDRSNPYHQRIAKNVDALALAKTAEDVAAVLRDLGAIVHTDGVRYDIEETKDGRNILLSKPKKDSKERYRVRIRIKDGMSASEIERAVLTDGLLALNLPMQVDASKLGDPTYIKYLQGSGVVKTNVITNKEEGAWFITDYKDDNGANVDALAPTKSTPRAIPGNSSTTESVGKTFPVTFNNVDLTIDPINRKVYKDGKPYNVGPNIDLIMDLASYLNRTGDSRVHGNHFLTKDNKLLNYKIGTYLEGPVADKIKKEIYDKKNNVAPKPTTSTAKPAAPVAKAEDDNIRDVSKDPNSKFNLDNEVLTFLTFRKAGKEYIATPNILTANATFIKEIKGRKVYLAKLVSYKEKNNKPTDKIDQIDYHIVLENGAAIRNIIANDEGQKSDYDIIELVNDILESTERNGRIGVITDLVPTIEIPTTASQAKVEKEFIPAPAKPVQEENPSNMDMSGFESIGKLDLNMFDEAPVEQLIPSNIDMTGFESIGKLNLNDQEEVVEKPRTRLQRRGANTEATKGANALNRLAHGGKVRNVLTKESIASKPAPVVLENNLDNTNKMTKFAEFSKLDEAVKQALLAKGITEQDFNTLPLEAKDNAVKCL